ncbi:transcription factor IIIB 60 kDa subunit isoform X1 [Cynara cardunculus var. scolymus]|uniref:transcription factor IIIB 60 kDa subunit isoform X1 n=1 Tax=Cynara cardunculus var. scolymus TaxID=59895 RepID=UPI000D62E1F8|nr:transcription factor IIIB 60 kDa subunit isoform X1 [Cynara cardunculus var. scolymus]XP_024973893.1 transcription factor IIIB 60 kDa subunit isoform X1 [Cynara cardunculus var. scolymus]XP_024973894.1 transcription factor IIIB 60 kDa subunit isoform X1 [Cynara cardunculus var. scolymus]
MVWCPHCAKNSETHRDYTTGSVCCVDCGKVVSQDIYTEDATFVKDSAGGAHLAGNLVRMENACAESHRRTLEKGNVVIYELIDKYGISNVSHATKYYQIAVERGFTKGRRTGQVAAACLYVACREKEKPFLLIEFSSELGVSVYELGTVYLQLCKLLSLQDHPFVQKPVDPSLFMHRYTSGLIKGDGNKKVLNTALHLAVSMKRDWMQTGRKPSGICAAAIYVSSVLHGYNFSRADVVKAVHICEATLTKRLIEFENTKAGSLTIEEFTENALEFEKEMRSCKQSVKDVKMPGLTEVVCQHKSNAVQSGFGLCRKCYMDFCGGLDGSEPPSFQRAEMERLAKESVQMSTKSTHGLEAHQKTNDIENGTRRNIQPIENLKVTEVQCTSSTPEKLDKISDTVDTSERLEDVPDTIDETDTLSDIDDSEVNCYINSAKESHYKKILWEVLNKEYVQEQAAKEAAAAAARKLYTGTPEEIREAQAMAAAAAKLVASKKENDKRKRALEAKNAKPAQTAAEAASQLFTKKKLSSKINYDVLNNLFDDEPSPKKNRIDDSDTKETESGKKLDETNDVGEEEDLDYDDGETEGQEWNYDDEQGMNDYRYDDYDGGDAYDDEY